MPVDSFKFLPRLIAAIYERSDHQPDLPIPWAPLSRPISESIFALVTSGGLYHAEVEPPFDLEKEQTEPTWGDPSFRTIPSDISQSNVGTSHLHINTHWVRQDINILLPIQRFQELAQEGIIGGLANNSYSFMGYQGYPPDTSAWERIYVPQIVDLLKAENVNCVLLTPS